MPKRLWWKSRKPLQSKIKGDVSYCGGGGKGGEEGGQGNAGGREQSRRKQKSVETSLAPHVTGVMLPRVPIGTHQDQAGSTILTLAVS